MGPRWYVELLGGLTLRRVDRPDAPPVDRFRTRNDAALLALLAFPPGRAHPREALIERFWPERDTDAGRMSLRTALADLRRILEPDGAAGQVLIADKTHVRLAAERVATDVQSFERALAGPADRDALHHAVDRYGGPLLPALYDDWVQPERERLAAACVAALARLTRGDEADGAWDAALDAARRAVGVDPLSPAARADLVRLLRRTGRPADARRQADDFAALWRARVGGAPPALDLCAPLVLPAAPLSRLWGRRAEIASVSAALCDPTRRLVTVTGPGGIGKTRLALAVARALVGAPRFERIVFVELAAAREADGALERIGDALEVPRAAEVDPRSAVPARLNERTTLLALDNLEQMEDAGPLVQRLLESVPTLTVLATSRRRLAAPGEAVVALAPLPPDDGRALFIDRARSADPTFVDSPAVDALVAQLEGFPLALELAAAWASVLSPERLTHRLSIPPDPTRPARHASMERAIAGSVDLLDAPLRDAFLALSVFRGGFDADAAEAVCDATPQTLASLRDRSLLSRGLPLFSLHETLREFGAAHLTPARTDALEARHAAHFAERAQRWRERLETEDGEAAALAEIALLRPNLERAIETALSRGDRAPLPALVGLFLHFWNEHPMAGLNALWIRWLPALEALVGDDPAWQGELALQRGLAAARRLELDAARALYRDAVAHFATAGDRAGEARTRMEQGAAHWMQGRTDDALACYTEAAGLWQGLGVATRHDWCRYARAALLAEGGAVEAALPELRDARERLRRRDNPVRLASCLLALGQTTPDADEARASVEEALDLLRTRASAPGYTAYALVCRGALERRLGEHAAAEATYTEALALCRSQDSPTIRVPQILAALGELAHGRGDREAARAHLRDSRAEWRRIGNREQEAVVEALLRRLGAASPDRVQ